MKQNNQKLTKYDTKLILSLLEDGRKTDVQISRETGISKAQVGRIRKKLEKRDLISGYAPIFDLDQLDINLFAVVLFQWKYNDLERTKQMAHALEEDPRVTFFGAGEGAEFTNVLFIGFSDLSEAHEYLNDFREKYGPDIGDMTSFFVPKEGVLKQDYTDIIKEKLEERRG